MIGRWIWLVTACAVCLAASGFSKDAAHVAEAYRAALELRSPERPELELYDAIGEIAQNPSDTSAWVVVQSLREQITDDPVLKPILAALILLNRAAEGDLAAYREQAAALRENTRNATLLRLVDVSDCLVVCPVCRGGTVCGTCKGTLKCPACRGRGVQARRSASAFSERSRGLNSSLSFNGGTTLRLRCSACSGTGKCPVCGGIRQVCDTCRNTGKVPSPEQMQERIKQLAKMTEKHLSVTLKDALTAREQTRLLAADLQRLQGVSDPVQALAWLNALPVERQQAAQWSQVAVIREELTAWQAARAENSAQKQAQRASLRTAVAQAQRMQNPLSGMTALLNVFSEYASCDALPEAQTAFEGLFAAAKTQRSQQEASLRQRLGAIRTLSQPKDRLTQVQRLLSEWPEETVPAALTAYAKTSQRADLRRFLEAEGLAAIRAELELLRKQAEAAEQEAASGANWWVFAGGGLLGLLVLYAGWTLLQGMIEQRREAKRKQQQREAIEKIRNTFSHRH